MSGNLLACLPLELRLRGKSTTQSHRGAIYYVDLVVREGITLEQAISDAKALDARRKGAGLDQDTLEVAALTGFGNATFEFSEEEGPEILEEFYPPTESPSPDTNQSSSLLSRLDGQVRTKAANA